MKDRVFIIWSGSRDVAEKVKSILERDYNYLCWVGGNSENDSQAASISETIIFQMKACNQSIVIFQNKKENNSVSNNLFYELGYTLALYGPTKVHSVRRINDNIILPTDCNNHFIEPIENSDSDDDFAREIVNYFIRRQKLSVDENKMNLINHRYKIHDMINKHYSQEGSKCSDYELAQYILFYMQAAHMFGDEKRILEELSGFYRYHNHEFSTELSLAVNMGISFLNMVIGIKMKSEDCDVYIDEDDFWDFESHYCDYQRIISSENDNIFSNWAEIFFYEHLGFVYMLYANNDTLSHNEKERKYKSCILHCLNALESIDELDRIINFESNNDDKGIIALFKAYLFRNLFVAKHFIGESDAIDWLEKSVEKRRALKIYFDKGAIDTSIYDNFCMEYCLSLLNLMSVRENADPDEIHKCRNEIRRYLENVKDHSRENAYIQQLINWYNQ